MTNLSPANHVVERFVELVKKNQGDNLARVVLFGSFARGDYNKDSDIDILLLLHNDNYQISESVVMDAQRSDLEFGEFETYISPMTYIFDDYKKWEASGRHIPLILQKVKDEGVLLYDADAR